MSKDLETGYNYDLSRTGGHQVVAKQVVEDLIVCGVPAKTVIAGRLSEMLQSLNARDIPESLSAERIAEAIEAVAAIRVMQCRRLRVPGHETLHFKQIRYPAFLWPIYRAIGDIINPDDAVELRVKLGGDLNRFESKDYDWTKIDETLRNIESYGICHGLEIATALPRGTDGSISIITFMMDNDRLVSHTSNKSHADALVRSSTDFRFGAYVWGTPRWEYNQVRWYHGQLRLVVDDAFRRPL